jgi:hypothetical protein
MDYKYKELCKYIKELSADNQLALNKKRELHDVYGTLFYEELAIEDTFYLIERKLEELDKKSL